MNITDREFWTLVHGMGFGAMYLLVFSRGQDANFFELNRATSFLLNPNYVIYMTTEIGLPIAVSPSATPLLTRNNLQQLRNTAMSFLI